MSRRPAVRQVDAITATCPTCGKIRWPTRAAARQAARRQGKRMRAYRCGEFWHLTSFGPASHVAWYRDQEHRT